jgi:hypothetical protein
MKRYGILFLTLGFLGSCSLTTHAAIMLGTAGEFSVLAGTTVTNTGPSVVIDGHVGVSPGTAITGFPPGSVTPPYTFQSANALALQAQTDLTSAYNAAASLAPTQSFLPAEDIGGLTLGPGVYFFPSSAFITGTLTLDAQGDPDAEFVFQIGSTLVTASNASVAMINGGPSTACNIFWQVGSSSTLGTNTDFLGHILALTSITLTTGASITDGSALARNGAVTMDSNTIDNCAPIPEPASLGIATACIVLGMAWQFHLRESRPSCS